MSNDALILEWLTAQHDALTAIASDLSSVVNSCSELRADISKLTDAFERRSSAHSGEIEAVRVELENRGSASTFGRAPRPRPDGSYRLLGRDNLDDARTSSSAQARQPGAGEKQAVESLTNAATDAAPTGRDAPARSR